MLETVHFVYTFKELSKEKNPLEFVLPVQLAAILNFNN